MKSMGFIEITTDNGQAFVNPTNIVLIEASEGGGCAVFSSVVNNDGNMFSFNAKESALEVAMMCGYRSVSCTDRVDGPSRMTSQADLELCCVLFE